LGFKKRSNGAKVKSWTGSPTNQGCKGDLDKLWGWQEHSFERGPKLAGSGPAEGQGPPPRAHAEGDYRRPGRSESDGTLSKKGNVGPGVEQLVCEGGGNLHQGVETEGVPEQVHPKRRGERDARRQGDGTRGLDNPCPAGEEKPGSVGRKRGRGRTASKKTTGRGKPTEAGSGARREKTSNKPPQETGSTVAGQPIWMPKSDGAWRGGPAKKRRGPHHGGRPPESRK